MVRACLALYEATLDTSWLSLAEELQDQQDALFWDPDGTGYYLNRPGDSSILLRIKEGEHRWKERKKGNEGRKELSGRKRKEERKGEKKELK